ncbi:MULTISPECIES: outer membrane beta-barrel protein [unclassified Roseivirga]|uniref:type IX secretion/gliding motility protein PorT/SprT n=1 Tax=unclassified Roseivirga TaxID=2626142 RepID=UPI00257E2BBB|nr:MULTISPECIES: outer membrane beta-barrel protein [unclassified Roseivirga]MEC7752565.1 outer membrane beta-barrel protein [Bacteroidota bacterium]
MQATHFWNQFYLHRAKIITLFLLCVCAALGAQSRKQGVTLHRIDSDKKKTQYGFFLGAHQNYYGIRYSEAFESTQYDQIHSVVSEKSAGFNLGFMVNFRLADQFTLRLVPVKIGLYQNTVAYHNVDGSVDRQLIESTRVEPGIFLKYRSIRRENSRMYIIAGVSGSLRAGKEDLVTNTDRLEIRRMDAKAEIGFGLERYFEFFKFSPEIRYARGFMNVMNNSSNFYHDGISRITTHNFSLYLHFSD